MTPHSVAQPTTNHLFLETESLMNTSQQRLRKVDVPEGQSGDWKVSKFEVTESGAKLHNLRASMRPGGRLIRPGMYTKLTRNDQVIVSDTPAEIYDHSEPVRRAQSGRVLINGLGLGMVLQGILDERAIEHVTVIENCPDVIALVAPHWKDRYGYRLTIVHADAFDWQPPKNMRYCVVWHDIWDNITSDNLPEMHRLHRKYGRRCVWQGSWCRNLCETTKARW